MGKVSVFKFNFNNDEQTRQDIVNIIGNYLNMRGFSYDNQRNCYINGKVVNNQNQDVALSVGASAIASTLSGGAVSIAAYSYAQGFEYYLTDNQLIIKAYILNKNYKQFIHSTFNNSRAAAYYYGNLQGSLFRELKKNNVLLASKEVEKINDGSEKNTLKILAIGIFSMVFISFLIILLMLR